jgi:fluoride exporter
MGEGARLYALVALGGALGSMARYAAQSAAQLRLGEGFPYGTMAVNLLGAALMGLLVGALGGKASPTALFLGTGVLGGFTTYSAFNQEVLNLAVRGEAGKAALYAGGTLVGALLCGGACFALGRTLSA